MKFTGRWFELQNLSGMSPLKKGINNFNIGSRFLKEKISYHVPEEFCLDRNLENHPQVQPVLRVLRPRKHA
jgi:hypothetical protein